MSLVIIQVRVNALYYDDYYDVFHDQPETSVDDNSNTHTPTPALSSNQDDK